MPEFANFTDALVLRSRIYPAKRGTSAVSSAGRSQPVSRYRAGDVECRTDPWRLAYVASTLPAVRAAVKAGLGVTARPVEMMSPDLRVLGAADGLPPLPDTEYLLCSDPATQNELAQVIFKSMQTYQILGNTISLPLKGEMTR